jgi:hypothetical protein
MANITTTATQSKPKKAPPLKPRPPQSSSHNPAAPPPPKAKPQKPKPAPREFTGSAAVLEAFLEEGVHTIFGYPGGAIMPIYDALYDYKDRSTISSFVTNRAASTPHKASPAPPARPASSSPPAAPAPRTWSPASPTP